MAAADENHRYEFSPEAVLSVVPPAGPEHALLVSRIFGCLVSNGCGAQQVVVDCGIEVGGGARIPDLTVWAAGMPPRAGRSSYAGTGGLLLAVEVVSRGSEAIDRVIKKAEYAKAGIGRYWIVERDSACTVHRHVLNQDTGGYEDDPAGHQPIARLCWPPSPICRDCCDLGCRRPSWFMRARVRPGDVLPRLQWSRTLR